MPYEFSIHKIPEMSVLAIRERVDGAGFPAFLGVAFPELYQHVGAHGIIATGEPFVVYHAFGPDGIDAEVCAPVAGPAPTAGRIQAHTLPAATVVRTLHEGPYEALSGAYDAIHHWVADHGYVVAGPHRERYLTGPDVKVPPSEYRTELDLPIVPAEVMETTPVDEPQPVG
jgi:effector-binding domain-containing protein